MMSLRGDGDKQPSRLMNSRSNSTLNGTKGKDFTLKESFNDNENNLQKIPDRMDFNLEKWKDGMKNNLNRINNQELPDWAASVKK